MKLKFSFLIAAMVVCSSHAFAYAPGKSSWTRNRTVVMHLSLPPRSTPLLDGFKDFGESAADALRLWNQYLAHMQFAVDKNSTLTPSGTDADTSVTFASTIYGDAFGARVLAVTLVTPRNRTIMEADVIFNNGREFDSYRGPYNGVYDFHRVALHEFGHVLGLEHPDENHAATNYVAPSPPPVAIMNSIITGVDELQPDDIAGAQSIYSNGPSYATANPAPNLVNLSTRAFVGTGQNGIIGGFIIQGSEPATMVIRGIGRSLRTRGISNSLSDPLIELRTATSSLATNDDWVDGPDAATIASYHLDPQNSRESALLVTLPRGNYTVVPRAYDNRDGDLSGTGMFELYDLHTTGGRAGNVSTRGQVLSGDDVMIGGFILGAGPAKPVVVRALGPSLAAAGVAGPLSDPTLELRDGGGNLVAANDNWQEGRDAALIQAEGFAPGEQAEAALQATLNPGSYTAIVRGANNTAGIALVEIYDLSAAP